MIGLLAAALAEAGTCRMLADGAPVEQLDCETITSWTLVCDVPEASGKIRVRAAIEAYGLETEARVPLVDQNHFELALAAPKLRPGVFVATKPTATLPVGKPASFVDFCPLLQPKGVRGERARLPLEITVSVHRQTGFAEETLEGGVVSRVPTYDEGTAIVGLTVPTLQKVVGDQPPAHVLAPPLDQVFTGQLQVKDPAGAWRTVAWAGHRFDVPMNDVGTAGTLRMTTLDFSAAEITAVAGGDPAGWIEADLKRWLAGDLSSYLGLAGFARSELPTPFGLEWSTESRGGRTWKLGAADRAEVAVARAGDRVRVIVAWRMTPLDPTSRTVIDQAADAGL